MDAQYQLAIGPTDSPPLATSSSVWLPATRVAFRFCLVYLGLYILTTQMMLGTLIPLPAGELPELGTLPPFRTVVTWVANHLFGVTSSLVVTGSGSGDKTFDWVQVFCFLAIAIAATTTWTLLDRKRKNYGWAVIDSLGRALSELLTDGSAVVVRRRVSNLPKLYRLRGAHRRDSAFSSPYNHAWCSRLLR
jgi:hypothetical protein